jgi:peptidoglycan/LPS O-acetylase OafA/YrhL
MPSDVSAGEFKASPSDKPQYLAFVDGLRAVSILAVVGFHVQLPGFSGGFVGVDVFFVISGFLIINQIKDELEGGRFSIFAFYARRQLRILPVFILVLLCIFIFVPFILPTPTVYSDFAQAAVASPLSLANVIFFLQQGYFDIAADQKPLLHTWTLSVEEQFYLVAPLALLIVFRLSKQRFGALAALLAFGLALVSLIGAIAETSTTGRNAAFYLAHWRAWEFVAGGLITGPVVWAMRRAPRLLAETAGLLGGAAIVLAISGLNGTMAYPSWRATLPVAGAVLAILAGLAQPRIVVARALALRWLVAIGLVSYGWYLWHWPILSFIRISRLGAPSLPLDLLGAGVLAFALACLSYQFVEKPIRAWRKSAGRFKRPDRIGAAGVAACLVTALIGGLSSIAGYFAITSFVDSRYGVEGQGVLDNGCRILTSSTVPDPCLKGNPGILLGDSHADALFGAFARIFDQHGIRLVSIARGGCDPILFAPSQRRERSNDVCGNLVGPFERMLDLAVPVGSVVIDSAWQNPRLKSAEHLAELVTQFDPARTHILFIGPVPMFDTPGLACIVLSDRFGDDRSRCDRARSPVEAGRAAIVKLLMATAARFGNVRYIDPIDVFCDRSTCRPYANGQVLYLDEGHVSPAGADRIYDAFEGDFRWLFEPSTVDSRKNQSQPRR